jgi:hypothetical protein
LGREVKVKESLEEISPEREYKMQREPRPIWAQRRSVVARVAEL